MIQHYQQVKSPGIYVFNIKNIQLHRLIRLFDCDKLLQMMLYYSEGLYSKHQSGIHGILEAIQNLQGAVNYLTHVDLIEVFCLRAKTYQVNISFIIHLFLCRISIAEQNLSIFLIFLCSISNSPCKANLPVFPLLSVLLFPKIKPHKNALILF